MIKLIETSNFKSLKYISRPLSNFHVLVGANATGKSTFMDVLKFLSDIVNYGIDHAILERGSHFEELTFAGKGEDIEIAIEASIPSHLKEKFQGKGIETIRYEIKVGLLEEENAIKGEKVWLVPLNFKTQVFKPQQISIFPDEVLNIGSVFTRRAAKGQYQGIISKRLGGDATYYSETIKGGGKGWIPSFKLGNKKSALSNLPEDPTRFPASTWLKSFLQQGVQLFILNSLLIRKPSPPGLSGQFKTDGSNLPWVIHQLQNDPKRFKQWISHLQTALPDISDITTFERPEDKHRYIKVEYNNGIEVPSWLVSDGTLRMLALTIPAYIRNLEGVFLIEEPENGIHPKALECIYQSLSSVYSAQVMIASHSAVILSILDPRHLLCFAKTLSGVTDIATGLEHPKLREWKGSPNLSLLFASGILS
jgi:predicted ATPase